MSELSCLKSRTKVEKKFPIHKNYFFSFACQLKMASIFSYLCREFKIKKSEICALIRESRVTIDYFFNENA